MKVFLSKKDNETKFELIQEQDGKCEVRFLNGSKKGETTTYTSGTIKRWWKEVEEVEEPAKERHLVPMPGIEKLEALKKEYSRKSSSKKIDRSKELLELDSFLGNTYNNTWYSSVKCYKIKKNGKTIAEVYPRRKNIEVRVKKVKDDFDSDILYKDGYKYYLPVHYYVSYETDYIKIIEDLLS